jgi:haloacetate dehalogenase
MLRSMFFEGFELGQVDVGEAVLRVRHGGSGPPVVLLHGHPRTHTTWHDVAPRLVDAGFTVVCPDLRGYGQSRGGEDQSKRAMARDVDALMHALGFDEYAAVGHDRGSCVAHRLAIDAPDAVSRLAVMDGVPVLEALERCDAHFAQSWWHWFFFAQTAKPAEAIISRDPLGWYQVDPEVMGVENHADWVRAVSDPDVVRAMVEDYRAGPRADRADLEADRAAGRRVACPTLVAWSVHDDMEELYGDPLAIWRSWVSGELAGARIDSGHHMAEEAPEQLATELAEFLWTRASSC